MNLIKEHINSYTDLLESLNINVQYFIRDYYRSIEPSIIRLLNFIDLSFKSINQTESQHIHFHFENSLSDADKVILLDFLAWKEHSHQYNSDVKLKSPVSEEVQIELQRISNKAKGDLYLPANINKRKIEKLRLDKKLAQRQLKFHQRFANVGFRNKVLINTQTKFYLDIIKGDWFNLYYNHFQRSLLSYVIVNDRTSLSEIEEMSTEILDSINSIVLFDCLTKKNFNEFNLKELAESWDLDIQSFTAVTFSSQSGGLKKQLQRIKIAQEKMNINANHTVFIPSWHLTIELPEYQSSDISISFTSEELENAFWLEFVSLCKEQELYELISTRLKNLYAVSYTTDLRELLIQDFFLGDNSRFLSRETKEEILELSDVTTKELIKVFDEAIKVISQSSITENPDLCSYDAILVDTLIGESPEYIRALRSIFGNNFTITDWDSVVNLNSSNCLILSYRDSGRGPFSFYPSILEGLNNSTVYNAVFPSFLFKNALEWARYQYMKDLSGLMSHNVYMEHFNMGQFQESLKLSRPMKPLDLSLRVDSEYTHHNEKNNLNIKIKGKRQRLCSANDQIIYKETGSYAVRLCVAKDLISKDEEVAVILLDDILENINIYASISNDTTQSNLIDEIKRNYGITENEAGRLWKMLLQRKSLEIGVDELYNDLNLYLTRVELQLVSKNHFISVWLNPESESIAPISKKIFMRVCSYLGLPKIYFILIQRLRNNYKSNTRRNNKKMISLLNDLFEDGCFDENSDYNTILRNRRNDYVRNHPLDELGIESDFAFENLTAIVEIIKSEIQLDILEWIEQA